jgi:hypothetical protein
VFLLLSDVFPFDILEGWLVDDIYGTCKSGGGGGGSGGGGRKRPEEGDGTDAPVDKTLFDVFVLFLLTLFPITTLLLRITGVEEEVILMGDGCECITVGGLIFEGIEADPLELLIEMGDKFKGVCGMALFGLGRKGG